MKDLSFLQNDLIAHRGLHSKDSTVPENSMAAFRLALAHGYSIELDIQMTQDEKIVVFHDETLTRLCKQNRVLKDTSYETLASFYLHDTKEQIPLLSDVLDLVNGKVALLIEIKPFVDIQKMGPHLMKMMANYPGKWAVFSFNPKIVYWFKKHEPNVIRGQISKQFTRQELSCIPRFFLNTFRFNWLTKPDFISYHIHDMPKKFLDRLMKKDFTIISFAAKSQEDYDFVTSRYHNVVFEYFHPLKNH